MASGCRECALIRELIAEGGDVSAHVAAFALDGHTASGALLPQRPLGTLRARRTQQRNEPTLASFSLGGSMVGGAVPTAAAPSAVAHIPAQDRLETRGSTASRLAERRDGLLPEVAPAQPAPRGQVPGRTSRPQAVPPRPGVRESICPRRRDPEAVLDTIRRVVADIVGEKVAIARATTLSYDVELECDEFVTLAIRLRDAYGPDADVPAWFAELDVDDLVDLTAGEVADFVVWCLV